ncbi:MAG: DUF3703 domain-containing protein [Flavobacterium sp.]|nr:DUF3703 domain-containing protein [Flavobacterium sp.]
MGGRLESKKSYKLLEWQHILVHKYNFDHTYIHLQLLELALDCCDLFLLQL